MRDCKGAPGWQFASRWLTFPGMESAATPHDDTTDLPETAEARRLRIVREAVLIAEAEAELAAGLGIPQAEANAWLDSLDTDRPLPFPARA